LPTIRPSQASKKAYSTSAGWRPSKADVTQEPDRRVLILRQVGNATIAHVIVV
jgi:hypothetical protein